jgi:hypothetical protein
VVECQVVVVLQIEGSEETAEQSGGVIALPNVFRRVIEPPVSDQKIELITEAPLFRTDFHSEALACGEPWRRRPRKVAGIVIRDIVVPATEGDADPLESRGSDRRVAAFAAAFLLVIV